MMLKGTAKIGVNIQEYVQKRFINARKELEESLAHNSNELSFDHFLPLDTSDHL